ncbi:hypothetical protein CEUSTIGMA_g7944.t1 [Chlamydomonas eustigma]|uniref:sulfiredoxin n=1 Tax=Chlamydomonas eustigma TaxID=1157962 RepID=A0A250XBR9_9CHLO|nr:hypothetical protein CEUSTIGMA_g7944.t1 [Chlamydomonas eustigma]|eukprot:GAX80506.1 hypothetical protein CEUSTIGMA_g7944.t1 [Chlamydomonas eustigma]
MYSYIKSQCTAVVYSRDKQLVPVCQGRTLLTTLRTEIPCHSESITTGLGNYKWTFPKYERLEESPSREQAETSNSTSSSSSRSRQVIMDIPVSDIIRPLGKTRGNDGEKVKALMVSIQDIGLQEPIDVLLVDGRYYGFSGCHRYEAHVNLGKETIRCRVRKANQSVLKMHMM